MRTTGPCKVLTPVLKSVISPTETLGGADCECDVMEYDCVTDAAVPV